MAGIHAIDHEANYVKGISYFINGQRLMENDTSRIYYILTANLALACNFRNDTSGLSYAKVVYPKSVIRHAVSASDGENEAFGHLARFCPHPVSRYAST